MIIEPVETLTITGIHCTSISKKRSSVLWPLVLFFGLIWSGAYLLFGRMHGLWPMFNSEFPFSIAKLFTLRIAAPRFAFGAIFAFLDGAIPGLVTSWIFLLALKMAAVVGTNREDGYQNKF